MNHGVWERTGHDTFVTKDLAFIYGADGKTAFIQETDGTETLPDNDTLNAVFEITITDLDGNVVDSFSVSATCTRIQN